MSLKIFNTLTKKIEEFVPLKEGEVKMYNCGPTVYDYVHIGNLRSYVFADTLRRTLLWDNYKVTQVINVTDIGHLQSDADDGEDKMTKALLREGKPLTLESMRELANFYFEKFKEDLRYLNIKPAEFYPFASDHIEEDKLLIERLIEKGFTYSTKDGVYFDTSKDKNYGKLGQVAVENAKARIAENTEKKNSRDFALWKFSAPGESAGGGDALGYEAPWGRGFPGWHIECSAMSMKYLGESFDIHTGGIDHIPIHHNNEIAQSENASGKPFAKYWMHNAFLNINNEKMAKSTGNFTRLIDLIGEGYSPIAYRFVLLQSHYRTLMNFSREALSAAEEALYGIYQNTFNLGKESTPDDYYIKRFNEAINNDLNTPEAIAILFELLKSKIDSGAKKATILKFDEVLGLEIKEALELMQKDIDNMGEELKDLLKKRDIARKEKRFDEADNLRKEIEKLGYLVEDSESGSKLSKK